MEALRAIERSARKKPRHPFGASKGTKNGSKVGEKDKHVSFWEETDCVVRSIEI